MSGADGIRMVKRGRGGTFLLDFYRGQQLVGFVQKARRGLWYSTLIVGPDNRVIRHSTRHAAIERVESKA
jgi:hypothetical protein